MVINFVVASFEHFIDYISLLKTRFILHILTGLENSLVAIAILCIDLSVYSVLFALSFPAVLLAGICGYVFAYPHPLGVPQFCKGYVDFLSQISSEAGPVIRFIYHDVRYIYYFFLGRFCPFYLDVALRPCFVCNSCSPPK